MKKILSLFLVFAIAITIFNGITVSAATKSGSCGETLTWTLDDNGVLTISGTGDIPDYRQYGEGSAPWHRDQKIGTVKKIIIGDGVVNIGSYAFSGCWEAESVKIGKGVKQIRHSAFYGCRALESVTIPDNVTTLGDSAFYHCDNLKNAVIGNGITSIEQYTFASCALESVTFGKNVSSIERYAFAWNKIKNLVIPDSILSIGSHAFDGSPVETLYIGKNLKNASDLFINTENLEKIKVSPENPYLTAKNNCLIANKKLIFAGKNFCIPNVTEISNYAFYGRDDITSIEIPASIRRVDSYAFKFCNNITDVYYGGTENQWIWMKNNSSNIDCPLFTANVHYNSVLKIATGNCDGINWAIDGEGTLTINGNGKVCMNCGFREHKEEIKKCVISDGITSIYNHAFNGCTSLKEITIPATVKSIKYQAFKNVSLENIIFTGTDEEWYAIEKQTYNDTLYTADISFAEKVAPEFSFESNTLSVDKRLASSVKVGIAYIGEEEFDTVNGTWEDFVSKGKKYPDTNTSAGYNLYKDLESKAFYQNGNYAAFLKYTDSFENTTVRYFAFTVTNAEELTLVFKFDEADGRLKFESNNIKEYKIGVSYHGNYDFDAENPDWDKFIENGMNYTYLNGSSGYALFKNVCPIKTYKTPGNYAAFLKYINEKGETVAEYLTFTITPDFVKPVLEFDKVTGTLKVTQNDAENYRIGVSYIGNSNFFPWKDSWSTFESNGKNYKEVNGSAGYVAYNNTCPTKVYRTAGNYQAFIKYTDNTGTTQCDYIVFNVGSPVISFDSATNTLALDAMGFENVKVGAAYIGDQVFTVGKDDWNEFVTRGKKYTALNGDSGYAVYKNFSHRTYNTKGNYVAFVKYVNRGLTCYEYITFTVA